MPGMNAPTPRTRSPLMALDQALSALLQKVAPLESVETVASIDADGRVLAEDLVSPLHVPPQDNTSMDGYAVRSADVTAPGVVLPVSQRIAAGHAGIPLLPGTCARIFTGAPMPPGADAVVMQEDTREVGGDIHGVHVDVVPQPGQWVRRAGEDVSLGAVVLARGVRLSPASVGLAAGMGRARIQVIGRPRVALFSTGDELVMPGEVAPEDMPPGAIYNSNRFFLRRLLERLGCEVSDLGIVPDRREATLAALRTAADHHDLILTSGGVSVGEEDHIKPAVQQLGTLDLWQIAMKPGKPFAYGTVPARAGTPVSPATSSDCPATRCPVLSPFCCWCGPFCCACRAFPWPTASMPGVPSGCGRISTCPVPTNGVSSCGCVETAKVASTCSPTRVRAF